MRTLFIAIFAGLALVAPAKANDWGVFLQGLGGGAYYSHGRPLPRFYAPPIVIQPRVYPGYGYAPQVVVPRGRPIPYYGGYGGGYGGGGYGMRRGPIIHCRHYVDAWGNEIGRECREE